MSLLSWILVGLVAGWLADMVMRGSGRGVLFSMILGVVGALVGGFLASALFNVGDPLTGFNVTTLLIAFIGAVIAIAIARALPGRSPV
ncbi:MAG: GlsB/YeaQ/YmgE family stress response membrane protein [Chloroflexi bacterium]|nr:MAG: GlsB/YeaQ/YmgE family stress response membrane protein [Chloroflexota bacterium]